MDKVTVYVEALLARAVADIERLAPGCYQSVSLYRHAFAVLKVMYKHNVEVTQALDRMRHAAMRAGLPEPDARQTLECAALDGIRFQDLAPDAPDLVEVVLD